MLARRSCPSDKHAFIVHLVSARVWALAYKTVTLRCNA